MNSRRFSAALRRRSARPRRDSAGPRRASAPSTWRISAALTPIAPSDRRGRRSRRDQRRGSARRGRIRRPPPRPARSTSSASSAGSSPGGRRTGGPRSARPSLIEALGRVDQQDRRLEPALAHRRGPPPSRRARGGGPGYVSWAMTWTRSGARIGRSMLRSTRDRQAAVVPVVAAPRLVADELDPQRSSPVGQPEELGAHARGRRDQPVDDRRQRGPAATVSASSQAASRSASGPTRDERVESRGRRLGTASSRRAWRPEVEAALDVVEVRQRRRRRAPGPASRARPAGRRASRRRSGSATSSGRRARSVGGVVGEPGRRAELLHVDLGLQVGRAEVAVDEARDVLVEPQREQQVVARDRDPGPGTLASRRRPRGSAERRRVRSSARHCRAGTARPATDRPSPGPAPIARPPRRERHALPLHRVEAHPQRRGLLARRPRGRRPPPRPPSSAGRERRASACRPSATRGGSGPSCPTPSTAARRRAGATSGATRATAGGLESLALLDEPPGPGDQLRPRHRAACDRPPRDTSSIQRSRASRTRRQTGPGGPSPIGRAVERDDRQDAGDAAREERLVGGGEVGAARGAAPTGRSRRRPAMPEQPGPHRAGQDRRRPAAASPARRRGPRTGSPSCPRSGRRRASRKIASSAPARSASRRA